MKHLLSDATSKHQPEAQNMSIPLTIIFILAAIAGFECGYIAANYVDGHFRKQKPSSQPSDP